MYIKRLEFCQFISVFPNKMPKVNWRRSANFLSKFKYLPCFC